VKKVVEKGCKLVESWSKEVKKLLKIVENAKN
jgi:hypothetical protein